MTQKKAKKQDIHYMAREVYDLITAVVAIFCMV